MDKIVISNDEPEIQAATEENQFLAANAPQVVSPNENHQIHIGIHSQIMNTNTDALNLHISEHGKFLGIEPSKNQKGDVRPPMKSSTPEVNRQAPARKSNIESGIQNLGVGTGNEAI